MTEPHKPLFTVFTATYNRAHTLPRVLDALERQTLRDFEWLIVDDGSTDDTRTLVESWGSGRDFPIRYVQAAARRKTRGVQPRRP